MTSQCICSLYIYIYIGIELKRMFLYYTYLYHIYIISSYTTSMPTHYIIFSILLFTHFRMCLFKSHSVYNKKKLINSYCVKLLQLIFYGDLYFI